MSLRQATNLVYAMHVREMGAEDRASFDRSLNSPIDGKQIKRDSIMARAESMGIQPIGIGG